MIERLTTQSGRECEKLRGGSKVSKNSLAVSAVLGEEQT